MQYINLKELLTLADPGGGSGHTWLRTYDFYAKNA